MKLTTHFRVFLVALCGLTLTACASTPKVESDYADGFNFAHLETYYLVPINNDTYAGQPGVSLTAQRIEESIKTQLGYRGMTEAPADQADIWVSYYVTSQDKTQIRTYNNRYNYHARYYRGAWGAGWGNDVDVRQFTEGQLLIDLVDPKSNHVVWRGIGTKRLKSSQSTEQREETINQYVEAMLAEVPAW